MGSRRPGRTSIFNERNEIVEGPYGDSILLNEIHRFFPALIYDYRQFRHVYDVFEYVDYQMDYHFNTYSRNRREYLRQPQHVYRRPNTTPRQSRPINPHPIPPRRSQTVWGGAPVVQQSTYPLATNDFITTLLASYMMNPITIPGFADPVVVRPTEAQIDAATVLNTVTIQLETPCAVCQDTMNVQQMTRTINTCRHTFHTTCIDTWFQRNVHCPICRHDIRITH
jgi:hypothetical protein